MLLITWKQKFPIKNLDEISTPEQEPEPRLFATPKPINKQTKSSS